MGISIPATALAQAIRSPARQVRLCRLIRQGGTDLIALDGPDAAAAGLLLARTATADIVDAHVVVCAQRAGQAVVTGATGDLRRISPFGYATRSSPGPRLVGFTTISTSCPSATRNRIRRSTE